MESRLGSLRKRRPRGATAIEYALVRFLVGAPLLVTIRALGVSVTGVYEEVENEITNATGS
jgi:Flp pilus assembly pilin Flp